MAAMFDFDLPNVFTKTPRQNSISRTIDLVWRFYSFCNAIMSIFIKFLTMSVCQLNSPTVRLHQSVENHHNLNSRFTVSIG